MHLHDRYQIQSEFSPIGIYQVHKIQDYSKDYFSPIKALEGKQSACFMWVPDRTLSVRRKKTLKKNQTKNTKNIKGEPQSRERPIHLPHTVKSRDLSTDLLQWIISTKGLVCTQQLLPGSEPGEHCTCTREGSGPSGLSRKTENGPVQDPAPSCTHEEFHGQTT